jgi:hypothetical protein
MDPLSAAVGGMMPPSLSYQPSFFDLPWRRKGVAWADTEMGEFIGEDLDKKYSGGGGGGGSSIKGGSILRYTDLVDEDLSDDDSSGSIKKAKAAVVKDENDSKAAAATPDKKDARPPPPHKLERALKRDSTRSVSPYSGSGFNVKRGSRVLI